MQEPPSNDAAVLFFREVVEPTVADFMVHRADRRRGCLACLALASMTEHYLHADPKLALLSKIKFDAKARQFKADIRAENWAVGAIADIANATKHVVRDKSGAWGYEDVRTHQLNAVGILRAGWPIGGHEVLIGPDRAWRLSVLLDTAMAFWQEKLGVTPATEDKPPR